MKRFTRQLFLVAIFLVVAAAHVYVSPEKLQNISQTFLPRQKNYSTNIENTYKSARQDISAYVYGDLPGPTKAIKPKHDFDINKLSKLKINISQKIEGKIISDEHGALILKTKNPMEEPCNEEVSDTFTFQADVTPPKKDSDGVFDVIIECNSNRTKGVSPTITEISVPFTEPFAIKNIRLGMTFNELASYKASNSIHCPEGQIRGLEIPEIRLCAFDMFRGYKPPEKHLELADTVAGLKVEGISLLFYKNILYAALIQLNWGDNRQIKEVAAALAGKFGKPADNIIKVKGMDISLTFQSWTKEEGHQVYNSLMWKNTNGQLLFYGASGVFPISISEIGATDLYLHGSSYKLFMTDNPNPNRPPQNVIITMVDPVTVELIATQAEKLEQELYAKNLQKIIQKQMDELTKIREQAKQDALSL